VYNNDQMTQKTGRLRCASQPVVYPSVFLQHGFTLIELIMVLVVTAVLAAVAMPSFNSVSGFSARGFHDQTLAYLRFAQKTAIAQRRTVCVGFTSSSITLAIAAAVGTSNCATAGSLVGPQGESPVVLNVKTGLSYSAIPIAFNFDSLGQPITSSGTAQTTQTIQVSGVGSTITVETSTGFVHE
jgi:MSHA pilin protein MshC